MRSMPLRSTEIEDREDEVGPPNQISKEAI